MCHWLVAVAASAALTAACLGDDPVLDRDGTPEAGTPSSDAGDDGSRASSSGDGGGPAEDARAPTVRCSNGQDCRVPDEVCCADMDGSASCTRRDDCIEISRLECDSRDDCPPSWFCCGRAANGTFWSSSCAEPSQDGVACAERPLCRSSADCPNETPCGLAAPDFSPQGFLVCD